jgi:hypothetical protein
MRALVVLALVTAAVAGCNPDFTEQWEVIDPRLLATRIDLQGDTTERARPKLGDTFAIRIFMGEPREPKTPLETRYDAKLELCLGFLLPNGSLACGALPGQPPSITFGGAPTVVSDDELRFDGLRAPPELAELPELPPPLDEIDPIALFGAVSVDGKVERVADKEVNKDPVTELFRCTGNEGAVYPDALVFSMSVLLDLGRPGDDNHHPSFACRAAAGSKDACAAGVPVEGEKTIPGEFVLVRPEKTEGVEREALAWGPRPDGALPWSDCASSGLVPVHLGDKEHTIRVRFDAADREPYQYEQDENGKPVLKSDREELRVSHAITELGGKLARHFSIIERDVADSAAELELPYTPPGEDDDAADGLTAKGRLVRVYFALRDERGGVDYITRELCLLPKL